MVTPTDVAQPPILATTHALIAGRFSEVMPTLVGAFHEFLDHVARPKGQFVLALEIDGGDATIWLHYQMDGWQPRLPPELNLPKARAKHKNTVPAHLVGLPTFTIAEA